MLKVDTDLLERWNIRHRPDPDFRRLKRVILRLGVPDPLPLFEVNIDNEILSAILGETVQNPGYVSRAALKSGTVSREDSKRYVQQLVQAYYHLGYDYVILPAYLPMGTPMLVGSDTAALRREAGRAWVAETKGPVTNWDEFERYGWCQVADTDTYIIEAANRGLPEGMGLIVRTRGVMEWLLRLMGFETLCYALADDPELVGAVAERVGGLVVGLVGRLAQIDGVVAICLYDDMGFRSGTFVSPADLGRYVLPWTRRCVEASHAQGLPFILHSCGNLERIMDGLIDEVGIDAKHSFEDTIMPMPEVKAAYGDRVGLLGGVDMHLLAAGTPDQVRAASRRAMEDCAPGGGYAFGSGNTIANYVPLQNFLAMIDEARSR
ncbi:MAG: uroporphyrinogen decarboxylase family protein [Anaerolineae bacterium]